MSRKTAIFEYKGPVISKNDLLDLLTLKIIEVQCILPVLEAKFKIRDWNEGSKIIIVTITLDDENSSRLEEIGKEFFDKLGVMKSWSNFELISLF